MKLHMLLIVGLALAITGCGNKEQAAPGGGEEAQRAAAPATEPAAAAETPAEQENAERDAFLEHMHAHAEKIDEINFALADGDLVAAMTPAYWLSRHEELSGIPAEWQPYVTGMREAASAVESAPDLEAARIASERITGQCQGCHAAAGVIALEQ